MLLPSREKLSWVSSWPSSYTYDVTLCASKAGPLAKYMMRTARSMRVQAIVGPAGDAIRLAGDGKLRICPTVNGRDAVCCAINMKANAKILTCCIVITDSHRGKFALIDPLPPA